MGFDGRVCPAPSFLCVTAPRRPTSLCLCCHASLLVTAGEKVVELLRRPPPPTPVRTQCNERILHMIKTALYVFLVTDHDHGDGTPRDCTTAHIKTQAQRTTCKFLNNARNTAVHGCSVRKSRHGCSAQLLHGCSTRLLGMAALHGCSARLVSATGRHGRSAWLLCAARSCSALPLSGWAASLVAACWRHCHLPSLPSMSLLSDV